MRLLFALLLLLPCGIASAGKTDIPAGPGMHLGLHLDQRVDIDTFSRSQAQNFQQGGSAVVDHLRSLPAVNNPPPPLCMDLRTLLRMRLSVNQVAWASIDLQLLTSSSAGWDCAKKTLHGIDFTVNFDGDLFVKRVITIPGSNENAYVMLPIRKIDGRVVVLGDRDVLVLRSGRFPWRPFDRRRFLDFAIPKAEKRLADEEETLRHAREAQARAGHKSNFSTQDRFLQELKDNVARLRKEAARATSVNWICVDRAGLPLGVDDCLDDRKPMEPNPDYWDRARPDRIQLIHAKMDAEKPGPETPDKWDARTAAWDAINWQTLQGIVLP